MTTNEKFFDATSEGKATKKRVRGTARQRLAKAASRILRDNSDQLVQMLYQRTLAGDVRSGRLLLAFMKKLRAPRPRKKTPAE